MFIKKLGPPWAGEAALYRLEDGRYVVVSAAPETVETSAFLADEEGEVLEWEPLIQRRGTLQHQAVLEDLELSRG